MRVSGENVLVIHDGSPEALVSCLICPDPGQVVAWFHPFVSSARNSRMNAAKRQVDLLGLDSLITPGGNETAAGERQGGQYLETLMLIQAVSAATARGCGKVIWPIRNGEDLDLASDAADRALLISRLITIDSPMGASPVRIETPLLDLSLEQMLELAGDLDAPLEASWWCQRDGSTPCGGCSACTQWRTAIARTKVTTTAVGTA